MRILYINHSSAISGAERFLLDLLDNFPSAAEPVVACPDGALATEVEARAVMRLQIPSTDVSFRLHPRWTAQGLSTLTRAAARTRQVVQRVSPMIVHGNSTRAGLMAMVTPPTARLIVQEHDCPPAGVISRVVIGLIAQRASAFIANSQYTAECVVARKRGLPITVIPNWVDRRRFDPGALTVREAKTRLGIEPEAPVLGLVGQITPWKGQDDAIRIVARLARRWPAVKLLVVGRPVFTSGSTRFDNVAYSSWLRELANGLGVGERVRFLGERSDIPEVMRAVDVLLVPSWHEPFGRVVVEGMAMGVPVVATNLGGPREVMEEGRQGLLLPPRRPIEWATAVDGLLRDSERREVMGSRGRSRASSAFSAEAHVAALFELYRQVLSGSPERRPSN